MNTIAHYGLKTLDIENDEFDDLINGFNTNMNIMAEHMWTMDGCLNDSGIDMGSRTASGGCYIDFHSSGNNNDYDSRIISWGGDSNNGNGYFNIRAGKIVLSASDNAYYDNGDYIVHGVDKLWGIQIVQNSNSKYLGIMTTTAAWGVDVWASDVKLKKNIEDTNVSALDTVNQFKHRQFNWKSDDSFTKIGYVAQELQALDEDFVFSVKQEDGSEILHPQTSVIIPYLSKAIQELNSKVDKKIDNSWNTIPVSKKITNGKYTIALDEIEELKNINTKNIKYEVLVSSYGNGRVWINLDDKYDDYFTVSGDSDIDFLAIICFKDKTNSN